MSFIANLNLRNKLNLLILSVVIAGFIFSGIFVYVFNKNVLYASKSDQVELVLKSIDELYTESTELNKEFQKKALSFINIQNLYKKISDTLFEPYSLSLLPFIQNNNGLTTEKFIEYFNKYSSDLEGFEPLHINKDGDFEYLKMNKSENLKGTKIFNYVVSVGDTKIKRVRYSKELEGTKVNYLLFIKYFPENHDYYGFQSRYENILSSVLPIRNIIIVSFLLSVLIIYFGISLMIKPIEKRLVYLSGVLKEISKGVLVKKTEVNKRDEVGEIIENTNDLIDGLTKTTEFSKELGKGNFDAEYFPRSDKDELGNSLKEMRESLKKAEEERNKQKSDEEKRNWSAVGHAKFADIVRNFDKDLNELSYHVISELVKYLNAIQGGVFVLNNDDQNDIYLELLGAFAYDRRKYINRKVRAGEGLVGECYLEKKTIYFTDIPEGYMDIVSGLGDTEPKAILIVPLLLNEELFGVLEIAGLNDFEKHEIEFVEKTGEVIASTISTVRNNIRTRFLLEQSQHQSEEMKEQEEELRQNMEELQSTQEEASRRETELQGRINAFSRAVSYIEVSRTGLISAVNHLFLKEFDIEASMIVNKDITFFRESEEDKSFNDILIELNKKEHVVTRSSYMIGDKQILLNENFSKISTDESDKGMLLCILSK